MIDERSEEAKWHTQKVKAQLETAETAQQSGLA